MTIGRRGFLGALLGIAAYPALSKIGFTLDPVLPVVDKMPIIMPTLEGTGRLLKATFMSDGGDSELPGPGHLRLMRQAGGVIFHQAIQYGGIVTMFSGIENHILFTPQQPIILDMTPKGYIARLIYRLEESGDVRYMSLRNGVREDVSWFGRTPKDKP